MLFIWTAISVILASVNPFPLSTLGLYILITWIRWVTNEFVLRISTVGQGTSILLLTHTGERNASVFMLAVWVVLGILGIQSKEA